MERLPLASVRAFVVVARLMSISRAAEELRVTPSAVSHQIKILENYLGVPLFQRQKNTLKLTAAGQRYMSETGEALQLIARATRAVKARQREHVLRVGAPPTLAALWLIPRLSKLTAKHPEIALTITASPDPALQLGASFDVALWYGPSEIPGLSVEPLGANRAFPICKPSLLRGEHALRTPSDLRRWTLLDSADDAYHRYHEPRQPGWQAWLEAAGVPDVSGAREMNLTPRLLMHAAVDAELGVGLSRSLIAADALVAREIVVPFGPALSLALTYNLVYPSSLAKRKDVAAFREWIMDEAATSTASVERLLTRQAAPQSAGLSRNPASREGSSR